MEKLAGQTPPGAQHHARRFPGCRYPVRSHADILSRNSESSAGVPAGILRAENLPQSEDAGGRPRLNQRFFRRHLPSRPCGFGDDPARKMPAGTPALLNTARDRRLGVQVLPLVLAFAWAAGQVLSPRNWRTRHLCAALRRHRISLEVTRSWR
jgi:hypothetical protein